MAQKTDLNVAPYYDDFDSTDNFNRVLFRPGFAIQARELTQLQSSLQHQIEAHGSHIFEEGAMVRPGQISFNGKFNTLKLNGTNADGRTIDLSQYYNGTTHKETPVVITGTTSGVKAHVVGTTAGTSTEQPLLHVQYLAAGTDNSSTVFSDNETISANVGVTHDGQSYAINTASATTFTATSTTATDPAGPASASGCAASVEPGIYYVRGMFVENTEQVAVINPYNNIVSARIGFTISETLVTPEADSDLTDNAAGSANFAAKGAHRLQINLTLTSLAADSTADANFIELMSVKDGNIQSKVNITEYAALEDTFARRTYDESGDYTVRPFQFEMKESVTIDDADGVYTAGETTDDGNVAGSDKLTLKMSPGKAYVRGFEIEKMAPTFKDVNKARDTQGVDAGISTFEVGNFVRVDNVFNAPDIDFVSGENDCYARMDLYDRVTTTPGSAPTSGVKVGVARARAFEYESGTASSRKWPATSIWKLYLFDIRMFTQLTVSGNIDTAHIADGAFITGVDSGATGIVDSSSAATIVNLIDVVGTFKSGEKLRSNICAESDQLAEITGGSTDLTISSIAIREFFDAKQVMFDQASSGQDFTADFRREELVTITGTVTMNGSNANLTGFGTKFTTELKVGDMISVPGAGNTGATLVSRVTTVTDDATAVVADNSSTAVTTVPVTRQRAKLINPEKNVSLIKLPKNVVKTTKTSANNGSSVTQFTVRRQFVATPNGSGEWVFDAGSGATFLSASEGDYNACVLVAGNGTGAQGDNIEIGSKLTGTGTQQVTFTDATIAGSNSACKIKFGATVLLTNVVPKTKTTKLCKKVKVTNTGTTNEFGRNAYDKTISLGRADVFKLVGVFDSEDSGTDAAAPTVQGTVTGTFTRGEVITGSASGAKARLIEVAGGNTLHFVQTGNTSFQTGDTITGVSSGATLTSISAITEGSTVITSNFLLDTGQRDNFYDISRIVRKDGITAPTGRLLVIHDYLSHGTGDCFVVDSYVDVANQMDYEDIPTYSATKIDPDTPEPTGVYPLYDTYDFRPAVEDIAGTSTDVTILDTITAKSFSFDARDFDGNGSSPVNWPKPGSFIQSDFDFYLPKKALVAMEKSGAVVVTEGASAEVPQNPKPLENAMQLLEMNIPAYTFKTDDVEMSRVKNQRFTMKDIGKLKDRIDNIEFYTALNMLERDAESFEITDANGLNRFKSGFVVDNFSGHRVGDVSHVDYRCSMDMENGELRPKHKTEAVNLIESVSTDAERTSAHYKKTGDLITLPYTEETVITQPYATRTEKLCPVLTSSWVGHIELSPSGDEWFETVIAPQLVINVEGNFNTFLAANRDKIGTVWNAWQTQWSGVVSRERRIISNNGGIVERTIQTSRTDLNRTGIKTDVVPLIDEESQGFRKISSALIPWIRAKTVTFTGTGFFPNIRLYPFFDKRSVAQYIKPLSAYTSDASDTDDSISLGTNLITNAAGEIKGTFQIPDPTIAGNPKFPTGEIQFRLTSSATNNVTVDPQTAGNAIYNAKGLIETMQETIIATRNGQIVQESVNQTTSVTSTSTSDNRIQEESNDDEPDGGTDPLAQTFKITPEIVGSNGGCFLSSVDCWFSNVDPVIPAFVEIRNTINGYPGPKVLPFGRVLLQPSDITTSNDASVMTKISWPSPVYLEENKEYCIVFGTNVPTWKMWIARMGETEVGGSRTVSEQPEMGVMFKSHNNTAWAPSLTEDIKLNFNIARFDNSKSGTLTLQNDVLPTKRLGNNPLTFSNGSTNVIVSHQDHNMYDTSNNVTISNVKSGLSTTLASTLAAGATTIALTSGTNFNSTSGKYSATPAGGAGTSDDLHYIKITSANGTEVISYTNASIAGNNITAGTVTRGVEGTDIEHAAGSVVEYYGLHQVPLTEINKIHTSIASPTLDHYVITTTTNPVISAGGGLAAAADALNGGDEVTVTENFQMDAMQTLLGVLELPGTSLSAKVRSTQGKSVSGSQTGLFSQMSLTNAHTIPINDNFYFDSPRLIASSINESNEMQGAKSFVMPITLTSTQTNLSPVIDLDRKSVLAISNRMNLVDESSDVTPTLTYVKSTEPTGDNNAAIYISKKVILDNPATAIKLLFAGFRHSSATIRVLYKILRSDDATDFDDLGWRYFNEVLSSGVVDPKTSGLPDVTANPSLDANDFQQYIYTAGVTDDGIGTPLQPFIAFSIKIIMQGTNTALPPRLKDFRAIALAT